MKLLCINDTGKPKEIPQSKCIQSMEEYTPIRIAKMIKQSDILGVELEEIDLDESCAPYELFKLDRFAYNLADLQELKELIAMTNERDEIAELLTEQLIELE